LFSLFLSVSPTKPAHRETGSIILKENRKNLCNRNEQV